MYSRSTFVWECYLILGTGGRPEASLGKTPNSETEEITGVQTGSSPRARPRHSSETPSRCLHDALNKGRDGSLREDGGEMRSGTKDWFSEWWFLLMWLRKDKNRMTETAEVTQQDIPVLYDVFSGPRLCICRMFLCLQADGAASCCMTHYFWEKNVIQSRQWGLNWIFLKPKLKL